jgi:hypothetical protein
MFATAVLMKRVGVSSPTPHDCVQDWADLQIVSDEPGVDGIDLPMLRELGHSLSTHPMS